MFFCRAKEQLQITDEKVGLSNFKYLLHYNYYTMMLISIRNAETLIVYYALLTLPPVQGAEDAHSAINVKYTV